MISCPTSAQVIPGKEDLDLAKKYQAKFEKSAVVAYENQTQIEFQLSSKNQQPMVVEDEVVHFISLRTKNTLSKVKFYDDNSEIVSENSFNVKGKSIGINKTCGNFESESIFYSDAKVCNYSIYFTNVGEIKSFKVLKKYNDVKYLTSIYFTDAYASDKRKIVVHVPDWMEVELKEYNFGGHNIQKTKTRDEKAKKTIYEYNAVNIDAFQSESFARGSSFTYPHILVLSKSYSYKGERRIC
ncbi:MAG: hypothetical protein M3512_02225 [Bacteroidota bacterium]|nr:hypothetical protein [Bacteroidota bacterium]